MKARVPRLAAAGGAAAIASLAAAAPALAETGSEPARGAPIGDVIWATAVGAALSALVLWAAIAYRDGRVRVVDRLAAAAERATGLPGWAALPTAIAGGSALVAVFGFYWDVAKHIDTGRDPGPFGTAAHYPILIGLMGLALAGFTAIVLGASGRVPTSVRIGGEWRAPLGGVLIFLCAACALAGFPLDDVWHALFGQDVTLWGPTHVLMVAGASLSTIGVLVLLVEGRRSRGPGVPSRGEPFLVRWRAAASAGAFLIGLSTLQGEFDFGVPQFQLVYHPILLMLAAGAGLVTARLYLGRFGALAAALFFVGMRGGLSLVIGPVLGMSTLHFPLYLAEAVCVELAAARLGRRRPLALGAASGVLIGTVGLAAEWGWSHVWMPLPWPSSLLPQAAPLGFAAALAGGVLGGFIGRALTSADLAAGQPARAPRWLLPAAAAAAVFVIAFPLPMSEPRGHQAATIALRDVRPAPGREVEATVELHPRDAAERAQWLTLTSWQGGGLYVDRLRKVAEGVYRSTVPVPVHGRWKTMLRMEDGRQVLALPVYMPEDRAIPAREIPAPARFTRPFVRDKKVLQREAIGGGWLALPAYLLLAAIAAGWLVAMGIGLRRLERTAESPRFAGAGPLPASGHVRTRAPTPA
ncbi:MAG: hypothetical protein IRZ21_00555 [Thermoleophilaceae bacterium]|nr:hypothetical protein [Thermoleophilaceae bacterium]